jgi:hypothetical protein
MTQYKNYGFFKNNTKLVSINSNFEKFNSSNKALLKNCSNINIKLRCSSSFSLFKTKIKLLKTKNSKKNSKYKKLGIFTQQMQRYPTQRLKMFDCGHKFRNFLLTSIKQENINPKRVIAKVHRLTLRYITKSLIKKSQNIPLSIVVIYLNSFSRFWSYFLKRIFSAKQNNFFLSELVEIQCKKRWTKPTNLRKNQRLIKLIYRNISSFFYSSLNALKNSILSPLINLTLLKNSQYLNIELKQSFNSNYQESYLSTHNNPLQTRNKFRNKIILHRHFISLLDFNKISLWNFNKKTKINKLMSTIKFKEFPEKTFNTTKNISLLSSSVNNGYLTLWQFMKKKQNQITLYSIYKKYWLINRFSSFFIKRKNLNQIELNRSFNSIYPGVLKRQDFKKTLRIFYEVLELKRSFNYKVQTAQSVVWQRESISYLTTKPDFCNLITLRQKKIKWLYIAEKKDKINFFRKTLNNSYITKTSTKPFLNCHKFNLEQQIFQNNASQWIFVPSIVLLKKRSERTKFSVLDRIGDGTVSKKHQNYISTEYFTTKTSPIKPTFLFTLYY